VQVVETHSSEML